MPLYEYECKQCGANFDVIRPISQADQPVACVKCSSTQSSRKISTCFAHTGSSGSKSSASSGCGSCSGKSCASCHN